MPIQQHYYLLYQNMWLLLITITQAEVFESCQVLHPTGDDPNVRDHFLKYKGLIYIAWEKL